ncbi:MAG: hypothetical protein U0838_03585 [Chloroflexota bacterium]
MLVVAHKVQVRKLGDRMAQGVIERAQRLLAPVEVDDRDARRGGGEGCRRGLEAVADQQERIEVAPVRSRSPTAASAPAAWASAGGSSAEPSSGSHARRASGSKPSATRPSTVCPWRGERCMPPASNSEAQVR